MAIVRVPHQQEGSRQIEMVLRKHEAVLTGLRRPGPATVGIG